MICNYVMKVGIYLEKIMMVDEMIFVLLITLTNLSTRSMRTNWRRKFGQKRKPKSLLLQQEGF